jgi:predicted AAA+ superfamily ATPase
LRELLAELPAVLIVGPRAAGKTTTAARHAASLVRLDRPAEAAAFHADPDAARATFDEPVALDDWQEVPTVLGAVKRAVDVDPRPGRFVLTGSVRADIEAETWPGTGQVVRVGMFPMTIAERLERTTPPIVDRLLDGEPLRPAPESVDLRGYIELALQGGFPEMLSLSDRGRRRWIGSYVDQLLTRDAELVDRGRDPARLRRYLEAYALNSAGLAEDRTLYDAAGIDRRTALAYEALLTNLQVVDALPPGHRTASSGSRSHPSATSSIRRSWPGSSGSQKVPCCATATSSVAYSIPSSPPIFVQKSTRRSTAPASTTCARSKVATRSTSSSRSAPST